MKTIQNQTSKDQIFRMRISGQLKDQIKKIAKEKEMTMSEMIRSLLIGKIQEN